MTMDGLLQQTLSGLATGGIYASVALALVMIDQATHHINLFGNKRISANSVIWA